jgi:hypothetical protein
LPATQLPMASRSGGCISASSCCSRELSQHELSQSE